MRYQFFIVFLFLISFHSVQGQWKTDTTNVNSGFTGISFISPQVGYGTYSNKVYKTTNGGQSWSTVKQNNSSFLEDIVATSNDSAFAFGTYGYIYFTYNSGNSWDSLYLDSSMNLLKAHAFDQDSIWFLGYNFNYTVIYKTGDGAQTFTSDTLQDLIGATGFDVMDNGRLLISGMPNGGLAKSIYYSDDDGNTWLPLNAVNTNQALDVTSWNSKVIMHTGTSNRIHFSQDTGLSFQSRTLSNSISYLKILQDSLALGFHGGSNYPKIYRSTNAGDTWSAWSFPFTGNISDVEQPYKQYPELIKVSVSQYPYLYTYCDKVNASLSSTLGYTLVCGDTTEISMGKHFSYAWNTGESSSTIKVTNPGNYWGVAENVCGNKDTVYFSINQIPIPIQVSNDTIICEGDSITLIARGGNNFSWFDMSGTQLGTDSTFTFTPTSNTQIGILIEDTATQCFSGDTVAIDVIQRKGINSGASSACWGDFVSISADTGLGYIYNWGSGGMINQYSISFPIMGDTTIQLITQFQQCIFEDSITISVLIPTRNGNSNFNFCLGDTIVDTLQNGTFLNLTPSQFGASLSNGIFQFYPDTNTLFELNFIDVSGCLFSDTVFSNLDTNLKSEVYGTANNNLLNPIQTGTALMIGYNSSDSTVFIEDSTSISSNGIFNLTGSLPTFYIKVIPDSTNYPNQLPTYYQNGAFFLSAIALQEQCKTHQITVNTLQGLNPGGPGFIGGNVYQGAGKSSAEPWKGLNIILADSLENPLVFSVTDSNGKFAFSDLPLGTYFLLVDDPKFSNAAPQQIKLDAANPILTGGVFIPVNGSLKLDFVISIKESNQLNGLIYPNPTTGKISFKHYQTFDAVRLFSIDGKLLKTYPKSEINSNAIDLSNFPNGQYFIEIQAAGKTDFQKITLSK